MRGAPAGRARVAVVVVAMGASLTTTACAGAGGGVEVARADRPLLAAEVVQLRRDQVLQRVEVALRNRGGRDVVVRTIRLSIPGFRMPGPLRKDSPVPAGQVVNFPVPYGGVACRPGRPPRVGDAVVTLRVGPSAQGGVDTVRVAGRDPSGLLQRIATRACAVQDVARQVELTFADRWRLERTADGTVAHGRLRARLVAGPPRDITQVAGAIMYGLRPDEGDGDPPDPLAELTPDEPEASVPVVVWAARCDAHTKGEIKKPYEFLVWVRGPDGEELAVTPDVGEPTRLALRHVCAF